ncbi:MAG: hypothetical protein R2772_10430 [Chitinophagales bacterium]
MKLENRNSSFYNLLASLSIAVLLIFSLVFSLERILSADTATYLYNLVNEREFAFGSQRFIAAFTQLIPLFFLKLNASLATVVAAYSFNMMLFHALVVLTIVFLFKDYKSAFVLLLSHLIAGSLLFYYPVSEYQMGLSLSILLYSYVKTFKLYLSIKMHQFTLLFFLLLLILYSHPLAIIFLAFLLAYFFLSVDGLNRKYFALFISMSLLIWFSKYLFFAVPNDTSNLDLIKGLKLFPENAWTIFWRYSTSYDYVFLVLVPLTFLVLVIRKKWLLSALYFFFILIHLHMCLSKLGKSNFTWYSSHIFQALYFATSLIFIEQVWDKLKKESLKKGLIFGLLILGLIQIYNHRFYNQNRIAYIDNLLSKTLEQGTNRGLIEPRFIASEYSEWFWALDIESLIYSSYKEDFQNSTVIIKSKEYTNLEELNSNDLFLVFWTSYNASEQLDSSYFYLEPNRYKFVEL